MDALDAMAESVFVARRSQSHCAGPGCTLRQRLDGEPLDVCVNYRRTVYCGKACQTADWKAMHKKECKHLIAASATAAAAAAADFGSLAGGGGTHRTKPSSK